MFKLPWKCCFIKETKKRYSNCIWNPRVLGFSWFLFSSYFVPGFLGGVPGFLRGCSGFFGRCSGFLGVVPGFSGVFQVFRVFRNVPWCSGVPVFRVTVFWCSWKYYMPHQPVLCSLKSALFSPIRVCVVWKLYYNLLYHSRDVFTAAFTHVKRSFSFFVVGVCKISHQLSAVWRFNLLMKHRHIFATEPLCWPRNKSIAL